MKDVFGCFSAPSQRESHCCLSNCIIPHAFLIVNPHGGFSYFFNLKNILNLEHMKCFQFRTYLSGTVTCSSQSSWRAETASGDLEPESTAEVWGVLQVPKNVRTQVWVPTLPTPTPFSIAIQMKLGWDKCQGDTTNGSCVERSQFAMIIGRQRRGNKSY